MVGDVLSIVSLLVAIGTAGYTLYVSRVIANREQTASIINEYYSSMQLLTEIQLREWRLAHLFETRANYPSVVSKLRDVAPNDDDKATRTQLWLNERAVALQLFAAFEHVVYQLRQAERTRNKELVSFLAEARDYFTSRLLVNPRLLFLWAREGGNLEHEFEQDVRETLRLAIESDDSRWDSKGPF